MRQIRNGENRSSSMRTDRYFSVASDWYFSTREGSCIGPYESKREAEAGLKDFIDFLIVAEPVVRSSFLGSLGSAEF